MNDVLLRRFAALLAVISIGACARPEDDVVFKTEGRLVEIYATVMDGRGRYLDGLSQENFHVSDNGQAQRVVAFEADARELSCAILLDTTGSMAAALPAVKNAAAHLVDQFREKDQLAVYGFTNTLTQLQDFTQDKAAAKRSVMRTRAAGTTALFDAIAMVAGDISRRSGKKAIVVFTDGQDNASSLNLETAANRVRKVGVPIYAVAQGEALAKGKLFQELKQLAVSTGGVAHAARKSGDVARIFDEFSQGLQHTYMLAYKPPPAAGDRKWRTIQVAVSAERATVRAKQGYYPE